MNKFKIADMTRIEETKTFFGYGSWRWIRKIEWFIRTRIFRQRRYLVDQWACEMAESIRIETDERIIDEIAELLKKEIKKDKEK